MTNAAGAGEASRPLRLASRLIAAAGGASLALRFALFCLVILVAGAFIIGTWVSSEIQQRVIERTAAVTALYVDSFVRPHLGGLETGVLQEGEVAALRRLLSETELGQKIVSFKVWSADAQVVFATDEGVIGQHFAMSKGLQSALSGSVDSELSKLTSEENSPEREHWTRLVETYAPVRSPEGGVIGAVEFYQLPDELLTQTRVSQQRGWLIVGASAILMYLLLVGLVAGASRTIERQNRGLLMAVEQQIGLQARINILNQRLRRAAAAKTETDEELLRRVAQDLHDGPAQDLSLALLRIEALGRPEALAEEQSVLSTIRFALNQALEKVRALSSDLRLPQIGDLGWRAVVEKAATEHMRKTSSVVHIAANDVAVEPSQPQRIAVFRVVQEALSNASRHSGAKEQWVSLASEEGWAIISVEDRGRGFELQADRPPMDRRARLGLQGMHERIELLGGSVKVISSKGRGTVVVARLPLDGNSSL